MRSKTDLFKVAIASDLHLGCKRVDTLKLINNLKASFNDDTVKDLDMIVLAGDVFDDLLSLNTPYVIDIDLWMCDLLRLCKKHEIALRVLKGTPSHDWDQSSRFVEFNEGIGQIHADLKYIDTLSIVFEEKWNLYCLYIPDEWRTDPTDTLMEVKTLMKERGLESVDFAFMHGQFDYQLPAHIHAPKHDSKTYQELVKYAIFIGHVHTYSHKEKIYAQGSHDRLKHGEEEAKGHIRATLLGEDLTVEFVPTVNAIAFKTIDLINEINLHTTIDEIKAIAEKLPDYSYIRLRGEKEHPLMDDMSELVRQFPLLNWSKTVVKKDEEKIIQETFEDVFVAIKIDKGNIESLITERLNKKGILPSMLDIVKIQLNEIIKEK